MYNLDYTLLIGMAVGSRKDVTRRIDRDPSLELSRERLSGDKDLIRRVEEAAIVAEFSSSPILYFDPLDDEDLCFALNPLENACVYSRGNEKDDAGQHIVHQVSLPRSVGYVAYTALEQMQQPESPAVVFEGAISPSLPLSYGMYTLLRLRNYIGGQFDPENVSEFIHSLIHHENTNNHPEAKKWKKAAEALLPIR